ncbi:MAG: hypothetical protein ABW321_12970 [Polyangiales bacterium]
MSQRTTVGARAYAQRVCAAWACLFVGLVACTPIPKFKRQGVGDTDAGLRGRRYLEICDEDRDCPVRSPCLSVRCEEGVCIDTPLEEGVALDDDQQVDGDCNRQVCDGRGQARKREDDMDLPRGDGNPCHTLGCEAGQPTIDVAPEATLCNGTGICSAAGICSVCVEGQDCTRPDDCSVRHYVCLPTGPSCEVTGEQREGGACGAGKICSAGSCVPCVLDAECEIDEKCQTGRVTNCQGGVTCTPRPVTGGTCGVDGAGETQYCVDGACTSACSTQRCPEPTDPCQQNLVECSDGEPRCMPVARDDGTPCGDDASCRAGTCVRSVLINGDFHAGLAGWQVSGDAARFLIAPDDGNAGRLTLSTAPDGRSSGGATQGALLQQFTVPDDALALRFVISGGHARVRLADTSGKALFECEGLDSDGLRVPVSWDLIALRGQTLQLSIEDAEANGDWAYVTTTGFDVIRAIDKPLRNSQFLEGMEGWETTGDGERFHTFETYNHFQGLNGVEAYGMRRSVSSYTRDTRAAAYGDASRGAASQQFVVPDDAVALRFHVHGGQLARVLLLKGGETIYAISGLDSDAQVVLASWDLVRLRGQSVRLKIEDDTDALAWGHIGSSGFDVITSYNGP